MNEEILVRAYVFYYNIFYYNIKIINNFDNKYKIKKKFFKIGIINKIKI